MNIYLDESGFSGNHLLDESSPLFVFASVAMPAQQADAYVDKVIRDFRIQGRELKGKNLTKTPNGHKAIKQILADCLGQTNSLVIEKSFALACKLFEYIFEPVISESSTLFYEIGFHKFVANLLYVEALVTGKGLAREVLSDFQKMMRERDVDGLNGLFGVPSIPETSNRISEQILTFALGHREAILEELNAIRTMGPFGNWVLDVSSTSVDSLLCYWGEKFDELEVYCDKSKPLEALPSAFEWMVGRADKSYLTVNGRRRLMTYNLARPVVFVDSAVYKGIQLADVIASGLLYALRHREKAECLDWLQMFDAAGAINLDSITPQTECLDLDRPEVVTNYTVLIKLIESTLNGHDVLDGMAEFISIVRRHAPEFLRSRRRAQ
jgi:hypothetical protein